MLRVFSWLAQVILLAVVNYAAGRLGLLLAVPPGFASSIFPPSGIALAAILLFGYRLWPGVFLGSFSFNIYLAFLAGGDSFVQAAPVAAGIATFSSLQAIVSAWMIRRWLGWPIALDYEKQIALFLMIGGPVGCLIAASLSVTLLWFVGIVPVEAALFNWFTWWVGDSIGVLIFTPLVVLLFGRSEHWKGRRAAVGVPLVVAFSVAVITFTYSRKVERANISLDFERRAEAVKSVLIRDLTRYEEEVYALASLFNSSEEVRREEFRNFVARSLSRDDGVKALEWVPRVSQADRESFVAAAQELGAVDFQIKRYSGTSGWVASDENWANDYFPVFYVEPIKGNEPALGIDLGSHPSRRSTLFRARDSGGPVATAPIKLAQSGELGFLVVVPVYNPPDLVDEVQVRRDRLQGFALAVLEISTMIERSREGLFDASVEIGIYDVTDPVDPKPIYVAAEKSSLGTRFLRTDVIDVAGRKWQLRLGPTAAYVSASNSLQSWAILVGSLLFTSLLTGFLLSTSGRAARIQQVVDERTIDLRLLNRQLEQSEKRFERAIRGSQDGHWDWFDLSKEQQWWSPRYYQLLGYENGEIEATHSNFFAAIHRDDVASVQRAARLHFEKNRPFDVEFRLRTKAGGYKWFRSRGYADRNATGLPTRMAGSLQDIDDRRKAEQQLRKTSEQLERALESGGIGIWELNTKTGEAYVSRHLTAQLGETEPWSCYEDWQARLNREDRENAIKEFEAFVTSSRVDYEAQYRLRHVDGTYRWILSRGKKIMEEDNYTGRIIGVHMDVTQSKEQEEKIALYARKLETSNQELEHFAYVASHDLQEPLRTVSSCCQVLQEDYAENLDAEATAWLELAVAGSKRMKTLIQDLLAFSRVSTGEENLQRVDAQDALDDALSDLSATIREKNVELQVRPLPEVLGDRRQLVQLFLNLVGNGIKYCQADAPVIQVGAIEDGTYYKFYVKDNGIGIAPEYFERIFIIFQRLHNQDTYSGTGIGLAMCKKIVERAGGKLWVESTEGDGSTFYFTLKKTADGRTVASQTVTAKQDSD